MAIADDDLERVRAASSIVEVVQQHVALRRVGRNWVGLCPFHAEKSGSFNVREETGRYKCFGCSASGDVFKFVQEIEHLDFMAAVERLANRVGIQLTYTSATDTKDRQRRKRMIDVMEQAVSWYHDRLLSAPDARAARDYLRGRGLAGDVAREFRLGWAPDDWDQLSKSLKVDRDLLVDCGLAFVNKRGNLQDSFRGRVLFPIFDDKGDPVAFGGRVLPGSSDPAKYKNSNATPIYQKSGTLYGLNWAKNDIVAKDQVIVCEGYTDVIGFHRAGVKRAVATCGTALTEDHVRRLKRFANHVVLAFDADAAGQGAAERFYEWEAKYQVQVSVARFPDGKDPGDLASSDPQALVAAIETALPFLGFRLNRVLNAGQIRTPEDRARKAEEAMEVVNEHPDRNVRKLYAAQVASHVGIPATDLVRIAETKSSRPIVVQAARPRSNDSAEFVAIALLIHSWDSIAPWLVEGLFQDDACRRAFVALGVTNGDLDEALEKADPDAREILERAAVADVEADAILEARNLAVAAVRRELAARVRITDTEEIRADAAVRRSLETLSSDNPDEETLTALLGWLDDRTRTSL